MPMPPPKPTTEGRRDRQAFHEMGQIVRALEANGPARPRSSRPSSARPTGRSTASSGRSTSAVTDGLVSRAADGTLHPV